MLMTGDAEKKAEKCIVEDANRMAGDAGESARFMSVNILKVGHHGSKGASSEEFLSYVKPENALISCGQVIHMDILIQKLYRDCRGLEQRCIGQTKVERLRCVSGMVRIKLRRLKL